MKIKDALKVLGLNQAQFARMINRSPAYVTRLKSLKVTPSLIESLVIYLRSEGLINLEDIIPQAALEAHGLTEEDGKIKLKLTEN